MVGIDGVTCLNRASILQAGVKTSIKDGNVSYSGERRRTSSPNWVLISSSVCWTAWGMWNTNHPYYFDTLTIGGGDVITTAVVLTSTTTGTVFVQNEITGQVAFRMYQMDSINALCGASAEWLVSDAGDNILDTSGVILTRAFASGPSGHVYSPYNPQDGAVFRNMTQGGALVLGVLIGNDQNSIGFISSSALSE
ncbi:hypothetical protein J3R82DRAFT_2906 [Butyriboletus roseoflavus]|nr:hypothetical protein J3R82DRAFT_2906 [Butyriboletus roseoflavus]